MPLPKMMRTNRQAMLILLALPIVLVSTSFSYRSYLQYRSESAAVRSAREIIATSTSLLLDLRRSESAQRGYLLTGQRAYLKPFEDAARKVGEQLPVLTRLVPSPDREIVNQIGELCRAKMKEVRNTIDLYDQGRRDEALAVVRGNYGDDVMSRISDLSLTLQKNLQQSLTDSRALAQERARNTVVVSAAGNGVMLLFLALAGLMIDRDNRRKARDQHSIRMLNEQITRELQARTDILESIQDGFCAFDSKGLATYVNPAAQALLGVTKSRLLGQTVEQILQFDRSAALGRQLELLRGNRETVNAEQWFEIYSKWFRLHFYPAAGGGFTLYFTDVTAQKIAEEDRARLLSEVQDARALLDTFFDNAPIGFGLWDAGDRFARANSALAKMNGMPVESLLGKPVRDVMPYLGPDTETLVPQVLSGESVASREFSGFAPGDPARRRTWVASYYPIRREDRIVGIGGIFEDITERKAIEESLRQSAKLESLGVLAGGIAHDFNNILTGILGNASLAMETISSNNPARAILADVVSAGERAAHLTRQLLAYAGKGRFVTQKVDLSDMVKEIGALVRTSIPRNVQVRFALKDDLPAIVADTSQLQQLVMNLVINAAEAIPPERHGHVTVATGSHDIDEDYIRQTQVADEISPGCYVFLEVHDTGIGMDQATISRIFDPFFTTKFTGRGLGLAAALGIVRGHKGALKVYSTPGQGTTFKVLLPASGREFHRATEAAEKQLNLHGSAMILVVDDEDIVRRATKATLERYGYSVVLAENGKEGVELMRALAEKISLVLLDLTMPVMSGEDALRQMRSIRPDVKVILSSGYNEVESVQRFTGKDLAAFLQKPYTSRQLAETIRRVLEDSAKQGDTAQR